MSRTIELEEGVVYAEDRPLGLEFIALVVFDQWMKRRGNLNVPERVTGIESFLTTA